MPRPLTDKYMPGQRFGKLTVVEVLKYPGIQVRCDCGRVVDLTNRYRLGSRNDIRILSCGKERCHPLFRDLSDQRFGRLVALEPLFGVRLRGAVWVCTCDCGQQTQVVSNNLIQGKTQSCGCLNLDLISQRASKPGNDAIGVILTHYIAGARLRGFEFALSREQFAELISQNCCYCGLAPSTLCKQKNYYHDESILYNGIDRKDNELGYVDGNCVPCCPTCNLAKGSLEYAEFIEWVDRLTGFWATNRPDTTREETVE